MGKGTQHACECSCCGWRDDERCPLVDVREFLLCEEDNIATSTDGYGALQNAFRKLHGRVATHPNPKYNRMSVDIARQIENGGDSQGRPN